MPNVPNFFIVGASKAGTTSLAQALKEHPSVFMTDPKEPNFFDGYDTAETVDAAELDTYLRLYDGVQDEVVIGEASVGYLNSKQAARHIHTLNPDAKILISLRNPTTRIISLYEMYVRHGLTETFEHATKTDPWLVRQCHYAANVERILQYFPKDQILTVDFQDVGRDWTGTMTKIHDFLGVERIAKDRPTIRNVGGLPKNRLLQPLMNRRIVSFGKKIIPNRFHQAVDKGLKSLAFSKMEVPKKELAPQAEDFVEDIQKLDTLLGTDFHQRWFATAATERTEPNPHAKAPLPG